LLASCDDRTFIELFETIGPARTAKRINCAERAVFARRDRLERRLGRSIRPPDNSARAPTSLHPQRVELSVKDGIVLVASDGHYWPGEPSTAHKAFVQFCRELKPVAVIMNGDAFDGATISRHPPIGWENNPTVQQEIEVVQDRLGEIEAAAGKARKIWPLGNHDARYETRLATVAPEYARVFGVHLSDHFPLWEGCWSCWINGDVVVKHRLKGGVHATHNNTVAAGKTMVTGHLHSLKVTPYNDYNGTRWGIDTGCLADPDGPQFVDYSEDAPRNHRSGFIVLQFRGGKLMWPDVVYVVDKDHVGFRGELIRVKPCDQSAVSRSAKTARATGARKRTTQRRATSATNRSRPASVKRTSRKR
jgi:hypothetical protein